MNEENPFDSYGIGSAEGNSRLKPGSSIYAHVVALLGALFVFFGAALAIVCIPPMLSQTIAQNATMMMSLGGLALCGGVVAAALSYRSTLRVYAARRRSKENVGGE